MPERGPIILESDPVIEHYKRHVNRDLVRAHLKLSVEERLKRLIALQASGLAARDAHGDFGWPDPVAGC